MRKVKKMLVLPILAGLLLPTIACKDSVRYERYDNAGIYEVGAATIDAVKVRRLEIGWLGGSIEIEQNGALNVEVSEEGDIESNDEKMRYYLDGSTLKIHYCAAGVRVHDTEKNLRVSIPANLAIEVECTSARINVLDTLETSSFAMETTSGNLEAERIHCTGTAELDTESGNIKINELMADRVSADTTSGGISVEKLSTTSIDVETVSGAIYLGLQTAANGELESNGADVRLKLLNGIGAQITYTTFSGDLQTKKSNVKKGKTYLFAAEAEKGACSLNVETLSGNLLVE